MQIKIAGRADDQGRARSRGCVAPGWEMLTNWMFGRGKYRLSWRSALLRAKESQHKLAQSME